MSATSIAPARTPTATESAPAAGERRQAGTRGWLMRRTLLCADAAGLIGACLLAEVLLPGRGQLLVALALPVWVVAAKAYGLYDHDQNRADHSTVDEVPAVFNLVTAGVWLVLLVSRLAGSQEPDLTDLAAVWAIAVPLILVARGCARAGVRRSSRYIERMVIVGAGQVGRLVARKAHQHPEYGIEVVGFVDDDPEQSRPEVDDDPLLGGTDRLPELVQDLGVDRVVITFSRQSEPETVALVRSIRDLDVQIDVVPRLFDVVGPRVACHSIEALPLIGLPPVRPARSSRFLKRLIDVTGAFVALLLTAPLIATIAVLIKLSSPGPVLFRQVRLGGAMREFSMLKFRTMRVGTGDTLHREYIAASMQAGARAGENGLFKLDRGGDVTRVGRWLRRTSLDELPQLVNVLRGKMSLVGPRPCISYEVEHFQPHHFERFLVPAGLTGLWQTSARAHAPFGEALDLDVAYARAWSLGLDLRLLCLTPVHLFRSRGTA
jgi:exopolysaccharide biosynthesis polyprenyl glycosylphosphotransferase